MATPKRPVRLLLVSPAFHGYWESIQSAFTRLGYNASTCRFDERATAQKLAYKLGHELPSRLGLERHDRHRQQLNSLVARTIADRRPEIVLAVKGDELDESVHDAIRAVGATSAVWIYDELGNTRFTPELIRKFGGVASYSKRDTAALTAAGIECLHVADAFDPELRFTPRQTNSIVHIGALYPAREAALVALARAAVPVRTYGREWSRHPIDLARTWGGKRPPIPSGREMSRSRALGLMAGAPAALNIHGTHDGFNMRTFEIGGAGGVQIIDRCDVGDIYEPGQEILSYSEFDELIELSNRAIADDRWGDSIRQAAMRRTMAEHTFLHRARQLEALWA